MRLTIFNGSPRGKKSNSGIIADYFLRGFIDGNEKRSKTYFIKTIKDQKEALKTFNEGNAVVIIFPLYADMMPGMVKEFFEWLEPAMKKKTKRPLGFIIHSGLPEAVHSRLLEKYLDRFGVKLSSKYVGTVVFPGSEGFMIMPVGMVKRRCKILTAIGKEFTATGKFEPLLIKKAVKVEKYTGFKLLLLKMVMKTGIQDFYWRGMLKKNKAMKNSYDRPFAE